MKQSSLIIVSEDPVVIHRAQEFAHTLGVTCEVKSPQSGFGLPSLASGTSPIEEKAQYKNVVPFPMHHVQQQSNVSKINDLEAQAIENAIHSFRGNLTEAAKALGIGRATLYRKVKLYNIDPMSARKRRAA